MSASEYARRAASWNERKSSVRITANPMMTDSSSEQNLSTIGPMQVRRVCSKIQSQSPMRSYDRYNGTGMMQSVELPPTTVADNVDQWDNQSLGLDDAELGAYFGALRESVA